MQVIPQTILSELASINLQLQTYKIFKKYLELIPINLH